jgi:hypothetical protein
MVESYPFAVFGSCTAKNNPAFAKDQVGFEVCKILFFIVYTIKKSLFLSYAILFFFIWSNDANKKVKTRRMTCLFTAFA